MRNFNYSKYKNLTWDGEILSLVAGIHEYKGQQKMYLSQKPAALEKLIEIARVQSIESSNAIEGIQTKANRLKQLVEEKTTPRNRDEEEIAGYRYVLNEIHESHEYIPITSNYILQLHKDLYRFSNKSFGGHYKNGQNNIVATDSNGEEVILFTPLDAFETPDAIKMICEEYNKVILEQSVDALLTIPIFIHDFLCIHPFNDGNGRISRLLTTLLLYRSGYVIGRYVSLEKKIAEDKYLYYDALRTSQGGWHEETDDPGPFIKYMLRTIIAAYKDFEERMLVVDAGNATALEKVRAAVSMKMGVFTKSEMMILCPGLGKSSIENSLTTLVSEGYITRHGKGKATYYVRADVE